MPTPHTHAHTQSTRTTQQKCRGENYCTDEAWAHSAFTVRACVCSFRRCVRLTCQTHHRRFSQNPDEMQRHESVAMALQKGVPIYRWFVGGILASYNSRHSLCASVIELLHLNRTAPSRTRCSSMIFLFASSRGISFMPFNMYEYSCWIEWMPL